MTEGRPDFPIRIWRKGSSYVGQIRELSILARDDEPGALVRKIEAERDALLQRHRGAGLDVEIELAASDGALKSAGREIGVFALKALIGAFAASVVIVIAVSQGANRLGDLVGKTLTGVERPFQIVDAIAEKLEDRPAELQQKTARSLEIIVHTLQPLASKLAPLFPSSCRDGDQNRPG